MTDWSWATGEASHPGGDLGRWAEAAAWGAAAWILQFATAGWTRVSWAAPDFLVIGMLFWHYFFGLPGALAAVMVFGVMADGLGALPLGLCVSSLAAGAMAADWMRRSAIGGLGGIWLGPSLGAAAACVGLRALIWGWAGRQWAAPLDVALGIGLTMLGAVLAASLRARVVRGLGPGRLRIQGGGR